MPAGQPVVVPDGQLEAGVGQVRQGQVVPPQGVFPPRADRFSADRRLLFARSFVGRQEITEKVVLFWIFDREKEDAPLGGMEGV